MQAQKRSSHPDVMRELFETPHRFDFMQAVCLLRRWLVSQGVTPQHALAEVLRFRNSVSMAFPAGELEDIGLEFDASCTDSLRIWITPTFIGLLGVQGVLPRHYTTRIADHMANKRCSDARALFDLFLNRLVALFYLAWRKLRLELAEEGAEVHALRPLLYALVGVRADGPGVGATGDALAGYAGVLRQRPASSVVIERLLSAHFGVPCEVTPNIGHWHDVEPGLQTTLGGFDGALGQGLLLGQRQWRRDLRVGLRIGPLDPATYDSFLPCGHRANALRELLTMFDMPCLQFEVRSTLDEKFVVPLQLTGRRELSGARLGIDTALVSVAGERSIEYRYVMTLV